MNKSELACLSAAELNDTTASTEARKVLILNFADTLFSRNIHSHEIDYDAGQVVPLTLIGGEWTKQLLRTLHQKGVVICVVTKSNSQEAEEAIESIKGEGIEDIIAFVGYDTSDDNKLKLISACKTQFSHPEGKEIQYYFLDDNQSCVDTALSIGIEAICSDTSADKTPPKIPRYFVYP